jgi:hypothetical protein
MKKYCAKHPYPTQDKAAKAMHNAMSRGGKKRAYSGLKVGAYKCDACGHYHWGHYGTNATPKRKLKHARSV